MIAAALFRRIEYRRRLFAYFIATYVLVTYANLVHRGSVAEVGLAANPILVLVFCGPAAARIAILTSFTILISTPFLRNLPGVARVLGIGPTQADPPDVWFQAPVIAGFLVTIAVELRGSEDGLVLRVEDNGVGLAGTLPSSGMGLRTMAYRAGILEGVFKIEAAPGGRTLISCRMPHSQATRKGELHAAAGGNRS
jgi:hypothetical protein